MIIKEDVLNVNHGDTKVASGKSALFFRISGRLDKPSEVPMEEE